VGSGAVNVEEMLPVRYPWRFLDLTSTSVLSLHVWNAAGVSDALFSTLILVMPADSLCNLLFALTPDIVTPHRCRENYLDGTRLSSNKYNSYNRNHTPVVPAC
jgi:hypothetical protein